MAGYSEKTETAIDVSLNFRVLSDSQIEDRLRRLSDALGLPAERLLTLSPDELQEVMTGPPDLGPEAPSAERAQTPSHAPEPE